MAENAGRVVETKTSYKTTGDNNAPGQVTTQPGTDDTEAPYNHDSGDVTGYAGVDPMYRTFSDARFKPLPVSVASSVDEVSAPQESESSEPKKATQHRSRRASS